MDDLAMELNEANELEILATEKRNTRDARALAFSKVTALRRGRIDALSVYAMEKGQGKKLASLLLNKVVMQALNTYVLTGDGAACMLQIKKNSSNMLRELLDSKAGSRTIRGHIAFAVNGE